MDLTLTFGIRDRSGWGSGPWDLEPDRAVWTDEATGYQCCASRNGSGSWCGYVAIDNTHPAHMGGYGDDLLTNIDVRGGLTFAGDLSGDERYYLGFDCAHSFDYPPDRRYRMGVNDETYRTLEYVRRQCTHLAAQLKELACSST